MCAQVLLKAVWCGDADTLTRLLVNPETKESVSLIRDEVDATGPVLCVEHAA